jgi:hypothetical protein
MQQRKINRLAQTENVGQQGVDQTGDNQPDQDQQTLDHAARKHRHQADAQHGHHRHPAFKRRGGDAFDRNRREVQADRHHHRAGHHRRHHALDPARADFHHHQTNQGVDQPAGDDAAEGHAQVGVDPLAVKAGGGDDHPDKGGAGAEIAGHAPAGDEKEQQGADTRHQNRQVGIEPHQHRHQHRGAKHGDRVLNAHHHRLPERETFIRRDHACFCGGRFQLPVGKSEHGLSP